MSKAIAKVFSTGRSQAVRLPKKFRFECDEVYINKEGDHLILTPKPTSWDKYLSEGKHFSSDYPDHIEDAPPQEREKI